MSKNKIIIFDTLEGKSTIGGIFGGGLSSTVKEKMQNSTEQMNAEGYKLIRTEQNIVNGYTSNIIFIFEKI